MHWPHVKKEDDLARGSNECVAWSGFMHVGPVRLGVSIIDPIRRVNLIRSDMIRK
jgi:hypothetical protein